MSQQAKKSKDSNSSQQLQQNNNNFNQDNDEFNKKLGELLNSQHNIEDVNKIFKNFNSTTLGTKTLCSQIVDHLTKLYNKDDPYYSVMSSIIETHKEMETLYDTLAKEVEKIHVDSDKFNTYNSEVKGCIAEREELKEKLTKYDTEFAKFIEELQEKKEESDQDVAEFKKAELKYRTTVENFCKVSSYTYNLICDLLEYKSNFVNPSITNVNFIFF